MAEYETVNSFPVVDQARAAARSYGRSILEAFNKAYQASIVCLNDSFGHCIPSLRRALPHDQSYDWEDDNDPRWSDELERLLDSEGHSAEDSGNALSMILSRVPFVRGGSTVAYKPSAANLRRPRGKSRSSIHSNGTGGTGDSLRSRTELFDHSGDEFEDAGMLPDEHIIALTSEEPHPTFMGPKSDAELQEEERLAEQREEAILQAKRERAQRLAVKRGLSDTLSSSDRPRSSGQGSLRDAIPLRRGRSSTLQSQASIESPLRGRSSTLGSLSSSGLPSPRAERSRPASPPPASPQAPQASSAPPSVRGVEVAPTSPESTTPEIVQDTEFTEFVQPEPTRKQTAIATNDDEPLIPPPPPPSAPLTVDTQTSEFVRSPEAETAPIEQDQGTHEGETDIRPITPSAPPESSNPDTPSPKVTKSPSSDKPSLRRTQSKVPGDYDPVSGYYRRKSDADLRPNE